MAETIPACPYCGDPARLVDGRTIYPHRPDLSEKRFYVCTPCDAWVGCHPGTTKPLGRLANASLRRAKQCAHAAFDPLWKRKALTGKMSKGQARRLGYAWLARELGVDPRDCHIGMFDEETCRRVVNVCAPFARAA